MVTPFDAVIDAIKKRGYHNHRLEEHSDIVSEAVWKDLIERCETLRADVQAGAVRMWLKVPTPGARGRKADLLVGPPLPGSNEPDITNARICVENKSVVTAHRNASSRYDDLDEVLGALQRVRPQIVTAAIVLVGTAARVLNVPDRITPLYEDHEFKARILPRLSTGDASLWFEFPRAVSRNRPNDPQRTVEIFRKLPKRAPALTHIVGYDYLLLVPVFVDNVNPPSVERDNTLGIKVDEEYLRLLTGICNAYAARWHPETGAAMPTT